MRKRTTLANQVFRGASWACHRTHSPEHDLLTSPFALAPLSPKLVWGRGVGGEGQGAASPTPARAHAHEPPPAHEPTILSNPENNGVCARPAQPERVTNAVEMDRRPGCGKRSPWVEYPIPPYTADFCCVALKLIVEVDGEHHLRETEKGWRH